MSFYTHRHNIASLLNITFGCCIISLQWLMFNSILNNKYPFTYNRLFKIMYPMEEAHLLCIIDHLMLTFILLKGSASYAHHWFISIAQGEKERLKLKNTTGVSDLSGSFVNGSLPGTINAVNLGTSFLNMLVTRIILLSNLRCQFGQKQFG